MHRPSEQGCPPTLRFLLGAQRHGSAGFLAFVRVEGDPPRPCRRERGGRRAANRSSDRGIASESHGWRRIRGHWRGSGPRLGPSRSRTARGVTAPGHLRVGALGDAGKSLERQDASGEGLSAAARRFAEASGSVAGTRVTRARPSSWRRSAPVEPHRRRRREPVGPPPVGRARPRRRKEVKARTGRIATRSPVA